jgi:hypothetical protein
MFLYLRIARHFTFIFNNLSNKLPPFKILLHLVFKSSASKATLNRGFTVLCQTSMPWTIVKLDILALDGGDWSASCSECYLQGKNPYFLLSKVLQTRHYEHSGVRFKLHCPPHRQLLYCVFCSSILFTLNPFNMF